jgi:hypothetical protein
MAEKTTTKKRAPGAHIVVWSGVSLGAGCVLISVEELLRNLAIDPPEKSVYHVPLFGVCDILSSCTILSIIGVAALIGVWRWVVEARSRDGAM